MDRKRKMKLPIYIEAAMGAFLVVILAMAGRNGMIPQNQKNDVMKQSEVEQKSDSDMQNEKEVSLFHSAVPSQPLRTTLPPSFLLCSSYH